MKRKLLSLLLCLVLAMSMLAGCGGKSKDAGNTDESASSDKTVTEDGTDAKEETAEVAPTDVTTVGPEGATHLEMWSFVSAHNDFYALMLDKWNKANPDKQLNITFTTYPYSDMHNKLTMAIQAGTGAPDLCDVEISQFPNFLKGDVQFLELNSKIDQYRADIVPARIAIYAKDGKEYGVPTHVGATVMYYNKKILDQYGIDYTAIKTWDDFTAAGKKLKEASNGAVNMTTVDTGGSDWLWLAMAEYGEDYSTDDGKSNIELNSIKKMITMQQGWLKDGLAVTSPGGQLDTDEGKGYISEGKVAAFPKAMWFMSRFINDMPDLAGQWAIAPCPVFEEGQPRSVGIGGTGTVVTLQSKSADLAAEFITYAKLSYDGEVEIWKQLGFDTCNTTIWSDTSITQDTSNKYIAYFLTNPFDTLNEIKDEIGKIKVQSISPAIHEQFNLTILNNCFENGANVDDELSTAQDALRIEE